MSKQQLLHSNRSQNHSVNTNRLLQLVLIGTIIVASIILVFSHRALFNDVNVISNIAVNNGLRRVPLPRSKQPAKGGLPPVPDSIRGKKVEAFAKKIEGLSAIEKGEGLLESKHDAEQQSVLFPLPSDAVFRNSQIILQPTFGVHRRDQNSVFAFAEGYDLNVYITFVESLKKTGFKGDVVLAVSSITGLKSGVKEYLEWHAASNEGSGNDSSINVISYALSWECYKKSGVRILPTNNEGRGSTTNHGFSDCVLHGMYSNSTDLPGNDAPMPAKDPRIARPVATARYELYWIWSKQYHTQSSILIVDIRDTYFQSNPFSSPYTTSKAEESISKHFTDEQSDTCRLDLFQENFEAVNIGKSSYNSNWIRSAYGASAQRTIAEKPVLCSGSIMGSQYAIELYTIAMVAQFDKTKCRLVGCDQGFHNFLFYDGSLEKWLKSEGEKKNGKGCEIVIHAQGKGVVNNLAAMRNTSLRSQGVLKTVKRDEYHGDGFVVVNDDGSTPSPVVHQFDRDDELKKIVRKRTSLELNRWKEIQARHQKS